MKCDNLFIDSCPVGCVSQSHLVHRPSQFPTHQAVDGWVWALKVIGCFCAQYLYHSDALSDVREILFARCGFVLLASPFQWSWLCDGAHVFYCRTFSILSRNHVLLFYSTTVHCVKKRLRYLSTDSRSLRQEQGGDEDAILPLVLLVYGIVTGGKEEQRTLCTSLLLNCLRYKRRRRKKLT